MDQRTYYGNFSPEALADFLVSHYEPQKGLQAQKFGQSGNFVVQIAHGDKPEDQRYAVTIGITRAVDNERGLEGLTVTMGEQQWFTSKMASYAAMMGLIAVLITPWVLFALLWPLSEMMGSRDLPNDIWQQIQVYVIGQGGSLGPSQTLSHPHLGANPG
jgi:hypothetical protein